MSEPDLQAAIKTAEFNRQTHVNWRDYWLGLGCGEDCTDCEVTRKAAGGLAHQEQCIVEYDNVLAVLRSIPTRRDAESIARSVLDSPAMRDLLAEAKAEALREAADEMWRIFLRLPNTPSPLGDHIQRLVADYRDRAANPYRETTTGGRDD